MIMAVLTARSTPFPIFGSLSMSEPRRRWKTVYGQWPVLTTSSLTSLSSTTSTHSQAPSKRTTSSARGIKVPWDDEYRCLYLVPTHGRRRERDPLATCQHSHKIGGGHRTLGGFALRGQCRPNQAHTTYHDSQRPKRLPGACSEALEQLIWSVVKALAQLTPTIFASETWVCSLRMSQRSLRL